MSDSSRIHNWIYVIIPIENNKIADTASQQYPLFAAFCKACRTYFTEVLPIGLKGQAITAPSNLDRYGCEPISEDAAMLP